MSTEYRLTDEELEAAATKLLELRCINAATPAADALVMGVAKVEIKRFLDIVQAIDHAKGDHD